MIKTKYLKIRYVAKRNRQQKIRKNARFESFLFEIEGRPMNGHSKS